MSDDRFRYGSRSMEGRKPSIQVNLPLGVRWLQPIFERLVLRLDIAEEQMGRIEASLARIEKVLEIQVPEE